MASQSTISDVPESLSPALQDLRQRVKQFVDEQFKKLKNAHYKSSNCVKYHRCCNTFTMKKSKARAKHDASATESLTKFLGNDEDKVTPELMVDVCFQVCQQLPGSRCMSTPTLNQPHQDHIALDKRLAEAETQAAESQIKPGTKMNTLMLKMALLKQEKARQEELAEIERVRAKQAQSENMIFAFFLRYNGIDPAKVLSGWSPEGEWGEKITLRWPGFNLDLDEKK